MKKAIFCKFVLVSIMTFVSQASFATGGGSIGSAQWKNKPYPAPGYYALDEDNIVTIRRMDDESREWEIEVSTSVGQFSCYYQGKAQIVFGTDLVSMSRDKKCTVKVYKSEENEVAVETEGDCNRRFCGASGVLDTAGFKAVDSE